MDDGKLNFQALLNDKNFQDGVKRVIDKTQEMGATSEKVSKKSTSAFGALGKSMNALSGVVKGVMASFGLLAGIGAIFSLIRGGARDIVAFDKSMVNMSAIAGKTRGDLKDLEKEIRKVASESINTATSVADMATELIKLGTSTDGVKALLKPVNDLSIASQMSADATAVLLKGTLNAFQETEDQATRYADVMASAMNNTALDANKLSDSFTYIASTANVAGYSIEETSAMIGVLVDNNVQASSAGRVLSSVFGRLAKGGKELEGELEKIRNSQDKLAQASKTFGAEGARLGVILANNKNRMAELTKEFENSGGSLSKLTATQLDSVSAKYEIMKSAWQEFVLSVENGSGVISKSIKGILDVLTTVLNGLSALNEYNPEAFKQKMIQGAGQAEIDRIKQYATDYIKVRKDRLKALGESYDAEQEFNENTAYQLELATKKYNDEVVKQLEVDRRLTAEKQKNSRDRTHSLVTELEAEKMLGEGRVKGLNAFIANLKGRVYEEPKGTDGTKEIGEDILKKRIALLDKIEKTERGINESVLSERESSTQKVLDKYIELNKEAVKLGMNTQKINELQKQELEVVNYKADTNSLKEELERRKELYTEFEKVKKDTSEQYATEMYSNLIDLSKDYYDTLSDELDKIDTKDMTAKEKDRYNVLMKMLVDYGADKSKQEREQLAKFISDTESTQEKLLKLKNEYESNRLKLTEMYSGKELELRLGVLEKEYKTGFYSLSDSVKADADKYIDALDIISGATKNQVEKQIIELNKFLKSNVDLSAEQRKATEKVLTELNNSLISAPLDTSKTSSAVANVNAQIDQTKRKIAELKLAREKEEASNYASHQDFLNKVAETDSAIALLENRLEDLHVSKLGALGEDIGNLGGKFVTFGNSLRDINPHLSDLFTTLGQGMQIAESVSKAVVAIGGAIKDGGGTGGSGTAEAIGAGLEVVGSIMNIFGSISAKTKQERQKFLRWQQDVYKGELEYQALLRKRKYDSIDQNLPTKDLIESQMDALKKDIPEVERAYMEQLEKIQKDGEQILDRWRSSSFWRTKTKTKWGDLVGVDYDELEKLYVTEKLEGDTKLWFEELQKVKEEMDAIGLSLEDLARQMDELMTGTNWQQLSSTFADMFANGTNDAIKFGETLEDVIRGAIVAGFKANYIDKEMQALFDNLAEISLDGELSQGEIDQFRKDAEQRFDYLNKTWEQLVGGLDIDFGEQLGGDARDSVKRITETQADRLTGITTGIQNETIQIRNLTQNVFDAFLLSNNLLNSSFEQLKQIEANTRRTADNTSEIKDAIKLIVGQKENNLNKSLGI